MYKFTHHKNMKPYLLTTFLLLALSCQRSTNVPNEPQTVRVQKPKAVWQHYLEEAEKDHEIHGAFDISKDTIVLLRRSIGIELSTNRGKSWTWLGKKIFRIDEFTVDDKGVWWGLERWKGIHEPSYCRIHTSSNRGKTWNTFQLNPQKFFPYHISSNAHQPLEIMNFWDKKVYRQSGIDPRFGWHYVKQLLNKDNLIEDISAGKYFINRLNNKLYVKRANGNTDTLLSFPKAWDIYNIAKKKEMIYVDGPLSEGTNSYFAVIKGERLLKEFTVPGDDVNLTITPFNHIYLTSTTGAYEFRNNKLIQIFK